SLFILILVGFGAAKLKMIDGRFSQQLSVFVINISSPCLIVSSVLGDISPDKNLILPVLGIGCVTYAFFVAVAMLLSRLMSKDRDMQGIYGFMLTFGNVGFIGYPIVASIFGQYAIFYASLLNIPFTILAFSLGKKMIQGGQGSLDLNWKVFVSPAMIACYVSVLIVVFDIDWLPDLVVTPLTLLGNITVPAALLVIGTSMAQMDLRKIFSGKLVWGVSVLRLLVLPVVIFYLTRLMGFDDDILGINTVLAAMPVGTYGAMFCLQYGKDESVMVQGILISTLLSIISIPLITQIL
ncbi:MAG TPA: AEC family transporter, partial [Candidatus Cryptobacteroides intestinipullorum]|nr:AEC family transporter [Candidatus Cryptobacteroides intestinipullorum]